MRWFFGCSDQRTFDAIDIEQSIDAYVSSKHVPSDQPVVLFVDVYQNKGWSHRALLVSCASLRVEWQDTNIENLGTGIRTTYRYHMWGEEGSHIIDPISLHGAKGAQEDIQKTHEIFVDIGGEKQKTQLEGILKSEESSIPWYWVVTGLGGTLVGWYVLRREKLSARPPTLEEEYRSEWGIFVQQQEDAQERAIYLSSLLRRYLDARFDIDIERSTPKEARHVVENARWPTPVRDAVLRIFDETDAIRFAGIQSSEQTFAELGRSLEVVFTVGRTS